MSAPRYRSVVLDVDSTLCGVEGIDWLAERRGAEAAARIRELTARAMDGEIPLERVYGERLAIVAPSVADVEALAAVYRETIAPGAREAVALMTGAGVRVVLVSGGLHPAIRPLADELGVELHAVGVSFDAHGRYAAFDATSPLTTQNGKRTVVEGLHLGRPAAAVGDGATDVAMRPAVDTFVAFTGFVRREATVGAADRSVGTFGELAALVLARR